MNEKKKSKQRIIKFLNFAVSNFIKNLLAAVGLASLFQNKIDWNPIVDKAIDIYQSAIYPFWDFLLGWINYDIPNYIKDILTINVLLLFAICSSSVLGKQESISLLGLIWGEVKEIFTKLVTGLKNSTEKKLKQLFLSIVDSLAQSMFNLFLSIAFITLAWVLYLGLLLSFLKNILSAESPEKKIESRKKLKNLLWATVLTFYGFIALLGLNYAIGFITLA